ncbi:hypothetical protein F5887DRAFT_1157839 [Amanita rubescens]|nr:hypothetical protein F5887DRAFT_1157839 [Amanita rubescens]
MTAPTAHALAITAWGTLAVASSTPPIPLQFNAAHALVEDAQGDNHSLVGSTIIMTLNVATNPFICAPYQAEASHLVVQSAEDDYMKTTRPATITFAMLLPQGPIAVIAEIGSLTSKLGSRPPDSLPRKAGRKLCDRSGVKSQYY